MKKTIILIGPSPTNIGGISGYIKGLINSELKKYYRFNIFDTSLARDRKEIPTATHLTFNSSLNTLKVIKKFKLYIKKYPDAIIHINSSCYWSLLEKILIAEISRKFGHKVIFHIHGSIDFFNNSKFAGIFPKILHRYDYVISVSPEIKDFLKIKNSYVIGNGVIFPRRIIYKSNNNFIIFISVSILSYNKRVDLIIEAALDLIEEGYKNFKLVIAGDGPEKNNIIEMINKTEQIEYVGIVQDDRKDLLYRKSNVYISASQYESFGLSLIEAMGYGLGIITTPTGVGYHHIKDNINGLIIDFNNKESLKNAMIRFIKQKININEISKINHEMAVDKFHWDKIAFDVGKIYQKLQ